jgi:hypothetical protein
MGVGVGSLFVLSLKINRVIRWSGMSRTAHVARIMEKRNACRLLVGKSEGKRLLGTLISIMEDNIKLDLQEMQYDIWCGL